jgi:hypothetical protein
LGEEASQGEVVTPEERWKIEGRTRDALRDARKSLAALKIDIDVHARKLREAAAALDHFLADPVGRGPTGMLKHEYLAHFYAQFMGAELEPKLGEFTALAEEIARLEKQIAEFDQ